jgi:GTPase SAR1 family protein
MFHNEEDIKNKLIVPYLKTLGFDSSEISFEKSFSVKVGKHVYKIDTERQLKSLSPRCDILVKRNGRNLCIIEVKRNGSVIDQEDINQGVSYARLLDEIAPICIVTNGETTKLIDSVTRGDLDVEKSKINNYQAILPDEAYYEAIKCFLGYSENNIREFCKSQVSVYMETLKGSREDRNKKYIEELYEPSAKLNKYFEEFMLSESQCFVTVGDSGSGKTCWICNLAEQYLNEGYPVFFYRAVNITRGITAAIAEDLNWKLSGALDEQQSCRKMFDIFQGRDVKPILFFIDGMDEVSAEFVREEFDRLLRRIAGYNIKLIATCKSYSWNKLLSYDGIPTMLSLRTFKFNDDPGFLIASFEESQFYRAVNKYKKFYNFKGLIQSGVLDDCRKSPYLLRIMFEVAFKKRMSNITYTTLEFFQEYFNEVIGRFKNKETTQEILLGISKIMYEKAESDIDLSVVRSGLNLPVSQEIDERLFELNILEKREDGHTVFVSFYFKKFRDFILAFKVLQWPRLSVEKFRTEMKDMFIEQEVRCDARNLYYILCENANHKRVLDNPTYERMLKYVQLYEKIINENFKVLKNRFTPFTKNEIGIFGYINLSDKFVHCFGFRPIGKDDPKVLLIPLDKRTFGFSFPEENLPVIYGAELLKFRGSLQNFSLDNLKDEVIDEEILTELKRIVRIGLLSESECLELEAEKIIGIYLSYYGNRLVKQNNLISNYSLPVERIYRDVLYGRAFRILSDRRVREKIDSGEIKTTRTKGGAVSYSPVLNINDRENVENEAKEIAEKGIILQGDVINLSYDKIESILINDLNQLKDRGVNELEMPYPLNWYDTLYPVELKNEVVTEYLKEFYRRLFTLSFKSYILLIKENFKKFCKEFDLFKKLPLKIFLVFSNKPDKSEYFSKKMFMCQSDDVDEDVSVIVCREGEILEKGFKIYYEGNEYQCFSIRWLALAEELYARKSFLPVGINERFILLRNHVYKFISEDFNKVTDNLSEQLKKSY